MGVGLSGPQAVDCQLLTETACNTQLALSDRILAFTNFMRTRKEQPNLHIPHAIKALALGIPVNAVDEHGRSPLVCAIYSWTTYIKILLAFGANPNQRLHEGRTPLHDVSHIGPVEHLQLLVNAGGDVNAFARCRESKDHTPLQCVFSEGYGDATARMDFLLHVPGLDMQFYADWDNANWRYVRIAQKEIACCKRWSCARLLWMHGCCSNSNV